MTDYADYLTWLADGGSYAHVSHLILHDDLTDDR